MPPQYWAIVSVCKKRTSGEGGGVFVPEELCSRQRHVTDSLDDEGKKKARGLNLAELAAKIRSDGGMDSKDQKKGEDGEGGEHVREEGGEE